LHPLCTLSIQTLYILYLITFYPCILNLFYNYFLTTLFIDEFDSILIDEARTPLVICFDYVTTFDGGMFLTIY